ncbi:hypothetical protein ABZY81_43280 [Streptomyces sp. NPDC006514]|uniref:hypothetical protein n=1 Tax=Streptomyces sp. NPDC006514 TaxID=3154308 RepID=UPI0033ADDDCD
MLDPGQRLGAVTSPWCPPGHPPAPPGTTRGAPADHQVCGPSHTDGNLPTAVALAHQLEIALSGWFGEDAATVLTARAWFTPCQCIN